MGYATSAEVQGEFRNIPFSTTTAVTAADVARFIDEASAYIDSKVGLMYQVPVTSSANALLVLKTICVDIVSARIKMILDVKTGKTELDQGVKGTVLNSAENKLKDIVKGTLLLDGAISVNSGVGVYSYAASNGLEATFKKGENQW